MLHLGLGNLRTARVHWYKIPSMAQERREANSASPSNSSLRPDLTKQNLEILKFFFSFLLSGFVKTSHSL